MDFKKIPNYRKKSLLNNNYKKWKENKFETEGFFPIFISFKEEFLLKNLSGNALKLYIYLGLRSGNNTGETWISIETICKYFEKSPRTISYWLKELIDKGLISRFQLEKDSSSHTFLLPYSTFNEEER